MNMISGCLNLACGDKCLHQTMNSPYSVGSSNAYP